VNLSEEIIETDVLIIGSEAAGTRAAIEASKYDVDVTIITKGRMAKSGATITAIMDMAIDSKSAKELLGLPGDTRDSPELFFEDIVISGGYMNNQKLVEVLVREAPQRARELQEWGLEWKRLHKMPGHRYPRSCMSTGVALMAVLKREVLKHDVNIFEDMMALDLLTSGNRVIGVVALDIKTGDLKIFKAKATILATGGASRIYLHTTTAKELTGDGHAMAYRVGAELVDMEFPQFMPAAFLWPPIVRGHPAAANILWSLNGWLLNKYGERFLARWDPERMEKTTRDIEARAIWKEIQEGRGSPRGGIYASLAHLPERIIRNFVEEPSNVHLRWAWEAAKVVEEKVMEVAPHAHFFDGGLVINEKCETSIPGLFAAGEVAGGVNGGNRLSGVAITQTQVQGAIAGRSAAEYALKVKDRGEIDKKQVEAIRERCYAPLERKDGVSPIEIRTRIQELAWQKVGLVRNAHDLEVAIFEIEKLKECIPKLCVRNKSSIYNLEWVQALEIENMLCVLEMIARAALMRTETRATHVREDYPKTDNENWLKNIIIKQEAGKMKLFTRPIVVTRLSPPKVG